MKNRFQYKPINLEKPEDPIIDLLGRGDPEDGGEYY